MKLPSINYLLSKSKESFLRFPLTILSAILAVLVGIFLVENDNNIINYYPFVNFLLIAALGVPVYFCVSILSTSRGFSLKKKIGFQLLATIILALIYFSLPGLDTSHNISVPYIRYGVFNLIAHLLVSFIPYMKNRQLNGFWNYNKILFIRILTSVLYSGFLYIGIALALLALNLLFNIDIREELYFEIYIVIIGAFNTWFFVAGIPENLDELEEVRIYPKGLKIFTQFVLLPLLLLYLIILYSYGIKILISGEWPKGIISYLIAGISTLGVFTLLLIHPYGNLKENSWIKKFTGAYYYILMPLIVLLFSAIWFRVYDYGITINRYAIVLLGIWLSVISIYFSFKKTNIKFIPISLAVILMTMSFGPWSMFSVSERSQVNRLMEILENNALLEEGMMKNEVVWDRDELPEFYSDNKEINDGILNDSTHNEVKSILDYLDDHHGFSKIESLFVQDIDSMIVVALDSEKHINDASVYMRTMGLIYQHAYKADASNIFRFLSIKKDITPVSSYDYLLEFNRNIKYRNAKENTFTIDTIPYSFSHDVKKDSDLVYKSDDETVYFQLNDLVEELCNEYGTDDMENISTDKMTLHGVSKHFEIKIEIKKISLEEIGNSISINSVQGTLFLKEREDSQDDY